MLAPLPPAYKAKGLAPQH
uniref:Uncharacterized protein n=1 Tax=Anguilla anguilla TaxID=7936 RepID=A0A0E9QVG9_ANGAN